MKKNLLFLTVLYMAIAMQAQKQRTVDYPSFESINTSSFEITRIETDKASFAMYVTLWGLEGHWVRINSNSYLKGNNSGKTYRLLRAERVNLDEDICMPDSCNIPCKLIFEPIDNADTAVDFSEGDISGAWNIKGISLADDNAKYLSGDWEVVGEPGNVAFAIVNDKLLYDGDIWNYKAVTKGKNTTLRIASAGIQRELLIKDKGNGMILLQNNKNDKGLLLTRHEQHPATVAPYRYEPKNVSPIFFTAGKVVLKGAFTNIPAGTDESQIIKIVSHENITFKESNSMCEVGDDGTFFAEFDVPYAQYVSMLYGNQIISLFVEPNDTLAFIIDNLKYSRAWQCNAGGKISVAGNSLAAQVNRYTGVALSELTEYYNMNNAFKEMYKHTTDIDKIYEYAEICSKRITGLLTDGIAVVDAYPVSSRTKDILLTNTLGEIFQNQLSAIMYYGDNKYEKNPEGVIVKREDFVPLNREKYFSIFKKYSDELLDNRLFLSAFTNWALFNRAAFELMDDETAQTKYLKFLNRTNHLFNDKFKTKVFIDLDFILFNKLSPANRDALSSIELDSIYTRKKYYNILFEETLRGLDSNLDSGFLLQATIGQHIFWNSSTVDELLEQLLYVMPHITDDIVRRELLRRMREIVREREGGGEKTQPARVTEFLKSLNDKYPDEHIVLDFWGLGCGPCRSGMISQRPLVENLRGKVRFCYISTNVSNPDAKVKEFFSENDIKGEDIRVSTDTWNVLSTYFNFNGIPHVEILSKDGNIVDTETHGIDLKKTLETLLGEKIDVNW